VRLWEIPRTSHTGVAVAVSFGQRTLKDKRRSLLLFETCPDAEYLVSHPNEYNKSKEHVEGSATLPEAMNPELKY
jgi:hypothetical protein